MNAVKKYSILSLCLYFISGGLSAHELVHLTSTPSLKISLCYMTKDNITQQEIYDSCAQCYVHKDIACALQNVLAELESYGYGMKIWDAYQPKNELEKIWTLIPDERYITNPEIGDSHTRAMSIDITLFDLSTGADLEMPTEFDCITCNAHNRAGTVSLKAQENRDFLKDLMIKYGFSQNPTDPWWHFELKGWQECPMLNIAFKDLIQ